MLEAWLVMAALTQEPESLADLTVAEQVRRFRVLELIAEDCVAGRDDRQGSPGEAVASGVEACAPEVRGAFQAFPPGFGGAATDDQALDWLENALGKAVVRRRAE